MKKKYYLLLLLPLSLVLELFARTSDFFAEKFFALHIYRWCSVALNRITGIFPFSVAELLVVVALVSFLGLFIRLLVRLVRKKGERWHILGSYIMNLLCTLSVILFLFVFFCGINYERYPFSAYSGLEIRPSDKTELYELCVSLAERANVAREETMNLAAKQEGTDTSTGTTEIVGAAGEIGMAASMTYREMADAAVEAMQALAQTYPVLSGAYTRPKPLLSSHFFSRMEITGIFFPFTMEANVNVHCTDYTIPVTMCHELSHLRGFMREDEANYVAYLACQESEEPYLRYSGLMLALVYTGNQLYREDKELFYKAREYYSEGVIADLRRDSEYWSQYEDTVISTAANAANNTYLKANNQSDGTKSYGRMVDLLLAEFRKNKVEE